MLLLELLYKVVKPIPSQIDGSYFTLKSTCAAHTVPKSKIMIQRSPINKGSKKYIDLL